MIYELLSEGAEHAKTGRDICNILGITHRELTAAIERERRQGKPICASTGRTPGYYIPRTRHEMELYCDSLLRRAGNIHKTRRACLSAMEKLPTTDGQKG